MLQKKLRYAVVCVTAILLTISVAAVPIKSGTYAVTAGSTNNVQLTDLTFVTVNSIGSAIALLNSNGVEFLGTIQFDFADGYTETATSQYDIGSAGSVLFSTVYTAVIFKHNGVGTNPRLTASTPGTQNNAGGGSGDYIIRMNGADNITFDGIDLRENTSNTVSASTTLTTTAAPMEYGYYIRNSGANAAQNNTIKNCTITMYNYVSNASTQSSTNSYGVAQYCDLSGAPNSGNIYDNITVAKAYRGIYLRGQATSEDVGCIIRNCTIGGATAGDIGGASATYNGSIDAYGIWIVSQKDFTVYNNTIQNVQQSHTTSSGHAYGLFLDLNTGASTINNNKIYRVINGRTGSSTGSVCSGLEIQNNAGIIDIYNNMIGGIQSNAGGTSTFMLYGIRVQGSGTINLYHNSVSLSHISTSVQQCSSASLGVVSFSGTVNVVNNMLSNSIIFGSNSAKSYSFYFGGGTLGTSDYNVLDITPLAGDRYTGYYAGDQLTFANWQGASGKDVNSKQFVVPYTSSTDLHLNLAAPNVIYAGIFISTPSITTDIDGEVRSYPFIGADEKIFTLDPQVFISGNHPSDSLVALNSANNVLAGIALNVSGIANTLTGITFTTSGIYNTVGPVPPIDFTNVTLWYSSSPTFSVGTSTIINNTTYAATMPALGANNLSFTGLSLPLPLGVTYIYVTFNVALTATPGNNVRVGSTSFTNITFGNVATTKVGINPVPQGGLQTIAKFYYNFLNTDFTDEAGWYEATTGLPPSDFISPNQVFIFNANSGSIMGWNTLKTFWYVAGANTKVIVGDGSALPVTVTVEAKLPIVTGPGVVVDVRENGILQFKSSYIPTALGTLSIKTATTNGSTVEYGDTTVTVTIDTVITANYCNLTFSGTTTGGAKRNVVSNIGVSRVFTPGGFPGATYGVITFNGGVVTQTVPSGYVFRGLRINNSVGATTLAGNVQVDSSLRFTTNLNVTAGQTLTLGTSATVFSPAIGLGILNLTGTGVGAIAALNNTNPLTTTFLGTSATLNPYIVFGPYSNYNLSATLSSTVNNYGQIPPATWDVNSTINITNVTTAGANSIVIGQPASFLFGNIIFDAPALAADYRLLGGINNTNAAGAGTALTPWLVNLLGNLTIGKTGTGTIYTVDLGAGTAAQSSTINIAKKLNQSDGIYRLMNTASATQHVDVSVTDDITLSNGTQLILSAGTGSLATLSAGNNFTANAGTTVTGSLAGVNNKIIFTKAGAQTFTKNGASFTNIINYIVNAGSTTQLGATSNLTVSIGAYINLLNGAVFNIAADNTLTVNGSINTGSTTGTFSGTPTSNLLLGGTATGSMGTAYFTSGSAILNNLTLDRGVAAAPSVIFGGTTGLTVHGTLTIGSVTNTNNTIDLGVNALAAGGSFATNIAATGTLRTQNLTATPIPVNNTWGGTVWYNAAGAQTMVSGSFNNINGTGGNRTLSSTGTIGIAGSGTCFTPGGGVYTVTSSTVDFNGSSAQNIPAFTFENLVISNASTTKTLVGNVAVQEALTLSNTTTLQLANFNLSLLSTAIKTARLNPVTTAATIAYGGTGQVFAQRYYPARRAWRLVAAPINPAAGTHSISQALQERGNGIAGLNYSSPATTTASIATDTITASYGTLITGGTTANGFDQSLNNATSIKYFNAGSWPSPANTNTLSVNSQEGWMLFVRGDRKNYGQITNQLKPAVITTLRPRGQLYIGTKSITSTGFTVVGNPYASAVDYNTMTRTGGVWPANPTYYVWDPYLGGSAGVGAFVTLTWNGTDFTRSSPYGTGTYDNRYIPSGAAIMVDFPAGANLQIKETDKNATNTTLAFRPGPVRQMRTVLNSVNADNSTYVNDGTLSLFDNSFNNDADVNDANKIGNYNENILIAKDNRILSIERRKIVADRDTIFYGIYRMQRKTYQLQFLMENMDAASNVAAFLEDLYLKTKTPVNMAGETNVDFTITDDAGSSAADRFRLVFKRSTVYTAINAFVNNSDIAVEWKLAEEFNINHYEIERSLDGTNFTKVGETVSRGNSNTPVNYGWLDASPEAGDYFYRIRSISNNGIVSFSEAVKVKIVKRSPALYVFPNPVTNSTIQLQLNNAPAGKYATRLLSSTGQLINIETIAHQGGTATRIITPSHTLNSGTYQLEVTAPDKKITVIKVLVNRN